MHEIQLKFQVSNNEVKYEALITRILMATELRVKNLKVYSDSNLVMGQMTGKFQVKDERMLKYKSLVEKLMTLVKKVEFEKTDRLDNEAANELAKLASLVGSIWERKVPVHSILKVGTSGKFKVFSVDGSSISATDVASWMNSIKDYLKNDTLLSNSDEAVKIKRRATDSGTLMY